MVLNLDISYTPAQLNVFFENPEVRFKVIRKGRRAGLTKGAANAYIEWGIEGISPMLWVDTINGNIERYFERYFRPVLKQLPQKHWNWNQQKKLLTIFDSIIDFRSADAPESIEGFGYKKIFLNEAGIILKDDYLYSNAILPMLIDFPDSQLIAAGVPKGKIKKDGNQHKFYELWKKCEEGAAGYWGTTVTSYDNPLLSPIDIKQIEDEVSHSEASQEIYGEFVEAELTNPFAHQYTKEKHESIQAILDPNKKLFISIDFNLNPFAVSFHHIWKDLKGEHHHVFQEQGINNGSIPAMIEYIRAYYGQYLSSCSVTGDATGKSGRLDQANQASLFKQLQQGLGLSHTQIQVPANPTHIQSRNDVNYFLLHFPDFKIHPLNAKETASDMKRVQCNNHGEIMKSNRNDISQRADFIDTIRYAINTWQKPWIERHRANNRYQKAS